MTATLAAIAEPLATIPPFTWVALAALLMLIVPRSLGHAIAALATALVGVQAFIIPTGSYAETTFLGFETVFMYSDPASRLFAIGVGIIATAAALYSWGSNAPKVQTAFALSYISSTVGVIYAGDWLSMIFFWELMAVTSTALVWHYGGDAVRAGYRYAIAHGIGGTLLLGAVVVHFASVDSFLYAAGASDPTGIAPGAAALLAALGIGVNCGFIVLHTWLPDTYPRPHIAASVFLSVFTTKTAVLVMYRAFPDGAMWLAYLGGAMAVYGAFFALLQYDPRRLLSYHIQAQVGYMLAGIGTAALISDAGFATAGGLAHAFNNILYKSLLFMAVGVVIYRTGEEDIRNLGGLWKVMPLAFVAYLVGALSITAVPGFNGFISKGMVIDAAHEVKLFPLLLGEDLLWWLLILGGVGTFMSFIKLGYYMFFHGSSDISPKDATRGQIVAMTLASGFCLYYGVAYGSLFELLPHAAEWVPDAKPYSTGHLTESAILLTAGFVGFAVFKRPLGWLAHVMRDVDVVTVPAVFYTGRAFVWGVTEGWAAVDRAVMSTIASLKRLGSNPEGTARRLGFGTDEEPIQLRSGIARSMFVLTAMVAGAIAILLFG
ncbi:Na(+)/H(+) antiporter subunit D [Halalkalirubrum salinum]|uniref:Na(+)/H(+) antiporter subunit D n=1 Tax=Halalkalirubrum salinum TaxID=2563889 RepID=UPI0010FAD11B|nr:Na(+)/H(+) antiporter subunit D [Halalkalirubrum salinum]